VAALQAKVLPSSGTSDQTAAGKLRPLVRILSRAINHEAHRIFTPYADTVYYDAAPAAVLALDDWVTITAITVNGTAVDTADWLPITRARLSPYAQTSLYPHWAGVRLYTGTWLDRATQPIKAVAVTGTRGYSAVVPEAIERATLIGAAQQWEAESQLWQEQAGAPGFPGTASSSKLLSLALVRLIHDYILDHEAAPWLT
jgi:hypothetical protein